MYSFIRLMILFIFLSSHSLFAQNGFIRGVVTDSATGETLIGVTVSAVGAKSMTATDLDGKFSLSVLPGTYQIKLAYISFQDVTISDVVVKAGEVTILNTIVLKPATSQQLGEVVITAQALRNTEQALLSMKMRSANMIDGISSANFRKIGDGDAASSMKRVPGVSINGGKYVFVRGLGDRYSKTILNGIDIPGLDPDRNSIQMDIFPTNVIDNIVVNKTFIAELPADFTGGVVDVTTKDFPEEKKAAVNFSIAYNPNFHLRSDYLNYEGGGLDFLGFDDGTRKIPAINNVPFYAEAIGNADKRTRYREILGNFNPTMAAFRTNSLMDASFGFNFGNQKTKENGLTYGYNLAFSYKNSTEFYKNAQFSRYGLTANPDINELEIRDLQLGDYGVNNTLISALVGFAVKSKSSKYKINLLHLQNGESKAGIFDYDNNDQGAIFSSFQHNLDYNQRTLTNLLFNGKHSLANNKWDLEWKVSPTYSTNNDPDVRFTRYRTTGTNLSIGTESGFPNRIWRELQEVNLAGNINVAKDYKFKERTAKLKFGSAYTFKNRNFIVRSYDINVRNIPLTGDPNELFRPENIWPYNNDVNRGTTYDASFLPNNPNQFDANSSNLAGYVSTEVNLTDKLKTVIGARLENFVQRYTGRNQQGTIILNNDEVLNNLGLFPSLNLIYALNPSQNLRFSYTKTIARPSFKELSYAEIFDPVTGRTFIGGLFRDANDAIGAEYWDGNLRSTDIQNLDLRWELVKTNGQTISISTFYKAFKNPIEIVQFAAQTGSFQPRNVGDAQVIGGELEMRQSLEFISPSFKKFTATVNYTLVDSRVKLSTTELESRTLNARTGQTISEYRDMAGQAPYLINGGLSYNGADKGFLKGTEIGAYYNVQGETLQFVGIVDRPSIYTKPFHSLNINMMKTLGKNQKTQIGFRVDNILNDNRESVFQSYQARDQIFSNLNPGVEFQLKLSYKIF